MPMPTLHDAQSVDHRIVRVLDSTGFYPLDQPEHGSVDDLCCCRYCSDNPRASRPARMGGVWDSQAIALVYDRKHKRWSAGEQWKVHFPSLHSVKPLRKA